MEFPSEMLLEYVRVYQRKEQTNIGCNPPGYLTADYINRHPDTYSSKHPLLSLLLFATGSGCWLLWCARSQFYSLQLPSAEERACAWNLPLLLIVADYLANFHVRFCSTKVAARSSICIKYMHGHRCSWPISTTVLIACNIRHHWAPYPSPSLETLLHSMDVGEPRV